MSGEAKAREGELGSSMGKLVQDVSVEFIFSFFFFFFSLSLFDSLSLSLSLET